MPKRSDITNERFGRLVAVRATGRRDPAGKILWLCKCDCGGETEQIVAQLRRGGTKSCGCYYKESRALGHEKLRTHGMYGTPTHSSWSDMLYRCRDKTNPRYGGRGIQVCERWLKFENFYADMGERPEGKTIDRYPDNDGNYEPGNCRWATDHEQQRNKSYNHRATAFGETKTVAEWAADQRCAVESSLLYWRSSAGWPFEIALTQKPRPMTKEAQ